MIVVNWFTKHPHTKNTYQPSCNLFFISRSCGNCCCRPPSPPYLYLYLSILKIFFFSPASVAEEFIKLVLYSLLLTLTYKYFCPFYYFYDNFNLTFFNTKLHYPPAPVPPIFTTTTTTHPPLIPPPTQTHCILWKKN